MQETWVRSLGQEDPLEKWTATYSSILACRIPWREEHGGIWSMRLQSVRHDWATNSFWRTHTHKAWLNLVHTHKLSSVAHFCPTLCYPMDCSTPGFPVHHQLPELPQAHVLRVSDAIQPSHPLLSLLLLPSVFPSIRVFTSELPLLIRWPKYWSFSFSISPSNEYSGLISFRID